MGTVTVVNKKHGGQGVYIGRPSVLGNPFLIGRDGDRETVIQKYRVWLRSEWKAGGQVRAELERLAALLRQGEDVRLACWCAPAACHGDVVREAVLAIASRQEGGRS